MFVLENGDKIQGDASAATSVDFHLSGLADGALKNLADGQLAATTGDLYTATTLDVAITITLVNTTGASRTVNLYHTPSAGTARRIIPKDTVLEAGYALILSKTGLQVLDTNGAVVTTVVRQLESFMIAASDETTDLSTGTSKVTFRMPYAFTVEEVRASVGTAPAGSVVTADINENGTSILSTKLTIDAGEKTSTTAATAAVISDSSIADDAEITIDIDTVGSSTPGAGLKVYLIGRRA